MTSPWDGNERDRARAPRHGRTRADEGRRRRLRVARRRAGRRGDRRLRGRRSAAGRRRRRGRDRRRGPREDRGSLGDASLRRQRRGDDPAGVEGGDGRGGRHGPRRGAVGDRDPRRSARRRAGGGRHRARVRLPQQPAGLRVGNLPADPPALRLPRHHPPRSLRGQRRRHRPARGDDDAVQRGEDRHPLLDGAPEPHRELDGPPPPSPGRRDHGPLRRGRRGGVRAHRRRPPRRPRRRGRPRADRHLRGLRRQRHPPQGSDLVPVGRSVLRRAAGRGRPDEASSRVERHVDPVPRPDPGGR